MKYNGIFFHFLDDFVLTSCLVMYSLFAPTPSIQYPFFNRAISISCFATTKRRRSNSDRFLFLHKDTNWLPGCFFGFSPVSLSDMYSLSQRHIMLCSVPYSFSNVRTETWLSRCFLTIACFCSGVYIRFFCTFSLFLHPYI